MIRNLLLLFVLFVEDVKCRPEHVNHQLVDSKGLREKGREINSSMIGLPFELRTILQYWTRKVISLKPRPLYSNRNITSSNP
jgi:hypothetical protein